jgi:signal transduction histidine kinase
MASSALVDARLTQLNKGLLAFRVGLYATVLLGLTGSEAGASLWVLIAVGALALVPALPLRILDGRRIEVGAMVTLGVELVIWWWFGPIPGLVILPIFSVAMTGLFLERRRAFVFWIAAVSIQIVQIVADTAARAEMDVPGLHEAVGDRVFSLDLLAELFGLLVVGYGFLSLSAILNDYQLDITERARQEVRLTELIEEKDRLIDTVAHELRTPLTAVVGFSAELAREDGTSDPEEIRLLAQTVADESRRLASLVDNLIVGARSELSQLVVNPEPMALSDEVGNAWKTRTGGQDWTIQVTGGGTVHADPRYLRHIIDNLLDNAFRHGGDPVEVDIQNGGGLVVATFRDGGVGFPVDDGGAVFDRFSARRSATSPGNIGLGLTVARDLARLMGGEVTLNGGSTIALSLPSGSAAS